MWKRVKNLRNLQLLLSLRRVQGPTTRDTVSTKHKPETRKCCRLIPRSHHPSLTLIQIPMTSLVRHRQKKRISMTMRARSLPEMRRSPQFRTRLMLTVISTSMISSASLPRSFLNLLGQERESRLAKLVSLASCRYCSFSSCSMASSSSCRYPRNAASTSLMWARGPYGC